jgi:hypothetical protein
MPAAMPYERFEAWKVSHELALAVYSATRGWPRSELYGLTSQLRRAALSAPTNIAEGCAKRGPAEFRRFLDYSLGSLSELQPSPAPISAAPQRQPSISSTQRARNAFA